MSTTDLRKRSVLRCKGMQSYSNVKLRMKTSDKDMTQSFQVDSIIDVGMT
jgi:hypothetical protein